MPSTEKTPQVDSGWRELEQFVDRIHALARARVERQQFYQQVLEGCVTTLAATGGAVWVEQRPGRWHMLVEVNRPDLPRDTQSEPDQTRVAQLRRAAASDEPVLSSPSGTADGDADGFVLMGAVRSASAANQRTAHAVIELLLRPGASPAVQRGWQEFLATVCQIASDYHTVEQLQSLQSERGWHDQALSLLHRVHGATDLKRTAFEVANEGRRYLAADRVSVLLRRGGRWRLLAASGVDHVAPRSDTAKRLVKLAKVTARWGEPVEFGDAPDADPGEVPLQLSELVEHHLDQSNVRSLVAVPIEFNRAEVAQVDGLASPGRGSASPSRPQAVLVAEQFSAAEGNFSRERTIELAQLCEPALRQAARFARFPLSTVVWGADKQARLTIWRTLGALLVAAALGCAVWALATVPYDFEIEAPATLEPLVVRDVFASASGNLVEVRFQHGDQVQQGDVLAVLHDPQLLLDMERVEGEIETVKRRREAIALTRTDRRAIEEQQQQSLPMSAESEQLAERLASLQRQLDLLALRREALTLRSPIDGQVITLDVQNLLRNRPVERGQVLLSVADTSAGWWLRAEVDQSRLGHVVAAQQAEQPELPVRYRLAGDLEHTYNGHIDQVSAVAVLDIDDLDLEEPAIEVRIAVDEEDLPAARPGMNAQVRIDCGERSVGYVWLHDVWEAIYSWWVF